MQNDGVQPTNVISSAHYIVAGSLTEVIESYYHRRFVDRNVVQFSCLVN
jgi:hypothetical protein